MCAVCAPGTLFLPRRIPLCTNFPQAIRAVLRFHMSNRRPALGAHLAFDLAAIEFCRRAAVGVCAPLAVGALAIEGSPAVRADSFGLSLLVECQIARVDPLSAGPAGAHS